MFFRRKQKKQPDSPLIRTSPSLPELNSQGIPWPEDLVDLEAIRAEESHEDDQERSGTPTTSPAAGGAKTSFQGPMVFHKPFRAASVSSGSHEGKISALYMNPGQPATFDSKRVPPSHTRYSQRRPRIPATFNLMVVGSKGTGKTSLLRLLIETADISPTATADQKAVVDRFFKGTAKSTESITTACVEICESRFDRVLFSVIDTPGLDFAEGRELKLERQVGGIIKYVDMQYADTMSEESKVVRQSKGDQHIHLCIYMVDPSSIMTAEARRGQSSLPSKTRSETTISLRTPPDLVPDTSTSGEDEDDSEDSDAEDGLDDESREELTMSPAEIRVIRRLSEKMNVLPVIAHADSLTDEKLKDVKDAIRRGLQEAKLDFGVFESDKKKDQKPANGHGTAEEVVEEEEREQDDDTSAAASGADDDDVGEEERQSRPVIKLRRARNGARALSRSRSRRELSQAAEETRRPLSPDLDDHESVANVRFSARIVAKDDLTSLMPFALIAPQMGRKRARKPVSGKNGAKSQRPDSMQSAVTATTNGVHASGGEEGAPPAHIPETPASGISKNFAFLQGPPQDLKGVFTRKYRWGTIDVLDPNHCDFAALRTAVLSTHMKLLKIHTKEVLYEKYRTEKLLVRRATTHVPEEQRQRWLAELGL